MKLSVETSELIKYRNEIALNRISALENHLDKITEARKEQNKEK